MYKKQTLLAIFLITVILLASCQPKETPQQSELSAKLSELTGLVELKQPDQDSFKPAEPASILDVNGQVQTGDDGRVRLDLSTGTIIRVAPSSNFTLIANDRADDGLITNIQLELGKIFIILKGGQANVETPSGVASVRGSYLKVEVDPVTKNIILTCLEGTCSATNPNGDQIIFTDGQKVTLFRQNEDGTWNSPQLGPMTAEDFQEWLDFNNDGDTQKLVDAGVAKFLAATTEAPTEEPTETPTEAPTEAPTEEASASNACSQLIEPLNGASFGKIGKVKFAWTEQEGAEYYILTFIKSDGSKAQIQTTDPSSEFFIEVLPTGGEYQWSVTPYGSDGAALCTSDTGTFTKPQADPTAKPKSDDPEVPPTTDPACDADPCSFPTCPLYPGDSVCG